MKNAVPYHFFSKIYDSVMKHVNFFEWAEFITHAIRPSVPKSILDLGCGTGSLLKALPFNASKFGLDGSPEMLQIAKKNYPKAKYYQGDIEKFDLPGKFDLVLCTHDTINYLLEEDKLANHFQSVYNALVPGGYYFFDISSEYNLQVNFHKQTFRGKYENYYLIWENEYVQDEQLIYSTLRFTYQEGRETISQKEVHVQRFYPPLAIERIVLDSGFKVLQRGGDYKSKKVHPKTSLLTYLVEKN